MKPPTNPPDTTLLSEDELATVHATTPRPRRAAVTDAEVAEVIERLWKTCHRRPTVEAQMVLEQLRRGDA